MKLKRLLEYDKSPVTMNVDKTSDEDKKFSKISDYIKKHRGDELGVGYFAIVYDKPGSVNTVIKTGDSDFMNGRFYDPYLDFIIKLMENPRAYNNPFLPQIFSIKLDCVSYEGKGYDAFDDCKYVIEMEKLEPLDPTDDQTWHKEKIRNNLVNDQNDSISQIILMLSRLTNLTPEEYLDRVFSVFDTHMKIGVRHIWKGVMERLFHPYMTTPSREMKTKEPVYITNKQLLEAIRLLSRHGKGLDIDMHYNNVMIRRSRYGLQLVITDPFS